ncbi:hypothetical protein [Hymenobacter cavernae]|uniref:HNH endonuclease n=1 Tax=Hymenobacter cavernae TaxID=2044852 RepID=A0ABQ1UPI3_9BACT|nr:hypothetical protein [Hymenobacter cavernae]GGF23418.1 hypothetical protein GCM10011383_38800 [Hymenobacter cavernae]
MDIHPFEEWLPAKFHPGFEVSNFGNVRFQDTKQLAELRKGADGFIYANLDLPVDYLVAAAWHSGEELIEGKFDVIHQDGDTTNNMSYNLVAVPL